MTPITVSATSTTSGLQVPVAADAHWPWSAKNSVTMPLLSGLAVVHIHLGITMWMETHIGVDIDVDNSVDDAVSARQTLPMGPT